MSTAFGITKVPESADNGGRWQVMCSRATVAVFDVDGTHWVFSLYTEAMDQSYIIAPNGFDLSGKVGKSFSVLLDGEEVVLEYNDKVPFESDMAYDTDIWMDSEIGVGFVKLIDGMDAFATSLVGNDVEWVDKVLVISPKDTVLTVTLTNTEVDV